jgi:hypothetical protein
VLVELGGPEETAARIAREHVERLTQLQLDALFDLARGDHLGFSSLSWA